MSEKTPPGEAVREFYRRQGEERERKRIEALLKAKLGEDNRSWSPGYVIGLINANR